MTKKLSDVESNPVAKDGWKIALGSSIRWDSHLPAVLDNSKYPKDYTIKAGVTSDGKWIQVSELGYGTPANPTYSFEFEMRDAYFKTWMRRVSKDDAIPFYVRADLNVYVDGNRYLIPDLWLLMDVHTGGHGTRIVSNWRNYSLIECFTAKQSTTVYGYRDGDKDQPWMLTMSTTADASGQVYLNMKAETAIYLDGVAPRYDLEFDYLLARKRFDTVWAFDLSVLFDGVTKNEYVVCAAIPSNALDATLAVAHTDKPASVKPEYIATATLRNNFTAPLAMRSSDYSHSYADSLALTDTVAWASAFALAVQFKAGIPILGDSTVTGTFTNTITFTRGMTSTHTETKTYTIPGQSVNVPAETALTIETEWNRSINTGVLRSYCNVGNQCHASANNATSTRNVVADWSQVEDVLELKSIEINPTVDGVWTPGVFTCVDLEFRSSTGSVGEVVIKEAKK